jgi:uncharacterized membrane protein (UPF0136 family)
MGSKISKEMVMFVVMQAWMDMKLMMNDADIKTFIIAHFEPRGVLLVHLLQVTVYFTNTMSCRQYKDEKPKANNPNLIADHRHIRHHQSIRGNKRSLNPNTLQHSNTLGDNYNIITTYTLIKMKTVSFLTSCALALLFASCLSNNSVLGFAPVRSVNGTMMRNMFMAPLRLDSALGLSKDDDSSPRGIVLNSAVGGLVFAGGLMGYVKAGSKASLMAGSTFGGLLLLSSFLISKKRSAGNVLGSGVSGLLTYAMGKKFLRSGKFMPAGFIATMGAAAFVYNLIEATINKKQASTSEPPAKEETSDI